MSALSSLRWAFAAAIIAVALYHLVRLLRCRALRRPVRHDVELTHAAIGIAMTLMLFGALASKEGRPLALLFAVPTVWFIARAIHGYVMDGAGTLGTSVAQVIGCAAMVYLLGVLAVGGAGMGTAGMSMPSSPAGQRLSPSLLLTGGLVIATAGLGMWAIVRLRGCGLMASTAWRRFQPWVVSLP